MKVPVAVIDTNVVVSGLLTKNESATICGILDGMLQGRFCFLLSPDLLDEYRRVLKRSKVQTLHGLTAEEIDCLLTEIVLNAIWREPDPVPDPAPDPGDNHPWALLNAPRGSVLVTGDRLLLENPPQFASVLTPKSFLQLMG